MIMYFADVHLEHRLYHTLTDEYITTAEQDTRSALESIYQRASIDDIDLIICGGDFFHNSKPTPENIRWAVKWFKQMDALGKPFYIIPGNHDISSYSHSLVFLKSLNTTNIFLIENNISKIQWFDWTIYFVPFLCPLSSRNKYENTLQELNALMQILNPNENNIVVSHIHEKAAQLGAESGFVARATEVIDLNISTKYKNTTFLSGHIHKGQAYTKDNGINVVYPGSISYMDYTDCGQRKGYVTFSKEGSIDFDFTQGIRLYKKYILPEGKSIQEAFDPIRMSQNDVVFIDAISDVSIDEEELCEYLKSRNCTLGKIRYSVADQDESTEITFQSKNPVILLEEYLKSKFEENDFDWKSTVLPLGKEFLIHADKYNRD